MTIETGDTVRHVPSGETWVVACVIDESLYWTGWPYGYAHVADCTLLKKGTDEQRAKLLRGMEDLPASDARGNYARKLLQEEEPLLVRLHRIRERYMPSLLEAAKDEDAIRYLQLLREMRYTIDRAAKRASGDDSEH